MTEPVFNRLLSGGPRLAIGSGRIERFEFHNTVLFSCHEANESCLPKHFSHKGEHLQQIKLDTSSCSPRSNLCLAALPIFSFLIVVFRFSRSLSGLVLPPFACFTVINSRFQSVFVYPVAITRNVGRSCRPKMGPTPSCGWNVDTCLATNDDASIGSFRSPSPSFLHHCP